MNSISLPYTSQLEEDGTHAHIPDLLDVTIGRRIGDKDSISSWKSKLGLPSVAR